MHDLQTISKLNAAAFADGIANYQAQGRYVVATYTGLHILSVETFSGPAAQTDATTALNAPKASPDVHRKLFEPTGAAPARDQSEDRALLGQVLQAAGRPELAAAIAA